MNHKSRARASLQKWALHTSWAPLMNEEKITEERPINAITHQLEELNYITSNYNLLYTPVCWCQEKLVLI